MSEEKRAEIEQRLRFERLVLDDIATNVSSVKQVASQSTIERRLPFEFFDSSQAPKYVILTENVRLQMHTYVDTSLCNNFSFLNSALDAIDRSLRGDLDYLISTPTARDDKFNEDRQRLQVITLEYESFLKGFHTAILQ